MIPCCSLYRSCRSRLRFVSAIARFIEEQGRARVTELAETFGVSTVTIRKDLDALAVADAGGDLAPLGAAQVPVLAEQPVLATILRAGLPLHQGLLNAFDRADNAFISAHGTPLIDSTLPLSFPLPAPPPWTKKSRPPPPGPIQARQPAVL